MGPLQYGLWQSKQYSTLDLFQGLKYDLNGISLPVNGQDTWLLSSISPLFSTLALKAYHSVFWGIYHTLGIILEMESNFEIPLNQKAILQHENGILRVTPGLPIQQPSPSQILVRTKSVALNPCDFKMPVRFPTPGLWDGCDYSGIVVAVGSEVAKQGRFRLGDAVLGAVQGSNQADPTSGAYCEYLSTEQDFAFHMPNGLSFSTAPAISGTAIATLGIALFWSLKISGTLETPSLTQEDVLVYGGSSTLGLLAIQMVKL